MSKLRKQSGLGLVEVMIAAAITTVIALAVSTLMSNMSRSQKSVLQTADAAMVMSQINLLFSEAKVCGNNFCTIPCVAISTSSKFFPRGLVHNTE